MGVQLELGVERYHDYVSRLSNIHHSRGRPGMHIGTHFFKSFVQSFVPLAIIVIDVRALSLTFLVKFVWKLEANKHSPSACF